MVKKSDNIHKTTGKVSYIDRCKLLKQKGMVLWFTGLSGSGKSTIAIELEKKLTDLGRLVYRLDGDNIRSGLNSDLGFSDDDRDENIRRISEVANLFKDAGVITLVSFISPFRKIREFVKNKIGKVSFYEIYVKADFETCKKRDPKGLYKKADNGEINDFTGVGSEYEEPDDPDLVIDTSKLSIEESVKLIFNNIKF